MQNDLNWLALLKAEVNRTSQAKVGVLLGYSVTAINQVIHGK